MIRIVRIAKLACSRSFCVDLASQAKAELADLMRVGPLMSTDAIKQQRSVKLVRLEDTTEKQSNEQQTFLQNSIKAIKTEAKLEQFLTENEDLIKGRAVLQLLEQLFTVYDRLKRGGSTATLEEYLSSPSIKPVFEFVLAKFPKLNGSQLALFIITLSANNYKNLHLLKEIEEHIATARHSPAFRQSANQLLKCLCALADAGLRLSIQHRQLNDLARLSASIMAGQAPSKVAAFVYYYHKLVRVLAEQSKLPFEQPRIPDTEEECIELDIEEQTTKSQEYSTPGGVFPKGNRAKKATKFSLGEVELVSFEELLLHSAPEMDLASISMALNGYALVGKEASDPAVNFLIQTLRKQISLNNTQDILGVLKACVNVGIRDPVMFTEIVSETARQLNLIEDSRTQEWSAGDLLLIHYYFVKFEVATCDQVT